MPRKRRKSRIVYTSANQLKLVRGGVDYFQTLIKLIDSSGTSIHIQIYIFAEDNTGKEVAEALKNAAKRGVKIFLLVDGYASQSLSSDFIEDLKSNGIQFNQFEPIFRRRDFYFGRRMHHKIVVVDGEQGLVGGINISDRYNDVADEPAWLDWAAHVKGESAATLEQICIETWNLESGNQSKRLPKKPTHPDYKVNATCLVGVRRNDWVMCKNQISKTYLDMFRNADKEMIIMSSYFLPGRMFRRGLKRAVRRGVKIRLILAGKSDIALAKYAERYMYTWLLRNQIRIFEYQPTVLHGKVATMDGHRTTIGSFNVNNISAYSSIELNLDVDNAEFAESVQHQFEKIIQKDCVEITVDDFKNNTGVFAKFSQYISYWIVRFTYFIFTFYFKQKE